MRDLQNGKFQLNFPLAGAHRIHVWNIYLHELHELMPTVSLTYTTHGSYGGWCSFHWIGRKQFGGRAAAYPSQGLTTSGW